MNNDPAKQHRHLAVSPEVLGHQTRRNVELTSATCNATSAEIACADPIDHDLIARLEHLDTRLIPQAVGTSSGYVQRSSAPQTFSVGVLTLWACITGNRRFCQRQYIDFLLVIEADVEVSCVWKGRVRPRWCDGGANSLTKCSLEDVSGELTYRLGPSRGRFSTKTSTMPITRRCAA